MINLSTGEIVLYKNDRIQHPKCIFLNNDHHLLFFEDNENGFSGFEVISGRVFSRSGYYTISELGLFQSERNEKSKNKNEYIHSSDCSDFIDEKNVILTSISRKNAIFQIDDSGKISKIIGSGKQEFCTSSNSKNCSFNFPTGIIYVEKFKEVWISDTNNNVLRRFSLNDWKENGLIGIPTKSGTVDGKFSLAMFDKPTELCSFEDSVFVLDKQATLVRKIDAPNKLVSTVFKNESFIKSISCDKNNLYFVDQT
jgi:hypothetical protein